MPCPIEDSHPLVGLRRAAFSESRQGPARRISGDPSVRKHISTRVRLTLELCGARDQAEICHDHDPTACMTEKSGLHTVRLPVHGPKREARNVTQGFPGSPHTHHGEAVPLHFEAGGGQGLTLSAAGKFSGIFWVTRPEAAHSVPRLSVTTKPTSRIDSSLWPRVVWKTRP